MNAHRVEVLDRADDDAIVFLVAHHLHLELFPPQDGFLDQHLVGRRGVQAPLDDVDELFLVVGNAAAGASHGEGGPDDGGKADLRQRHQCFRKRLLLIALAPLVLAERPLPLELLQRLAFELFVIGEIFVAVGFFQAGGVGKPRLRRLQPDLLHGVAEQLAVFGLVDRVRRGADHLDVEFGKRAEPAQ